MPEPFIVHVINKATGQPAKLTVSHGGKIQTQADAENHILNLPRSHGGTHPGFELAKPAGEVPPAAPPELAK